MSADEQGEIERLRRQLREAQHAHRIIAERLAEYERSRPAKAIRQVWRLERFARNYYIKRRLQVRALRRRFGVASSSPVSATGGLSPTDGAPQPVQLGQSDTPTVSIVIPVHNHVQTTANCLASIDQASTDIEFEVVVVDDASSDGTSEFLAACSGIQVVTLEQNQGYLRAVNQSVRQVRGTFVCLLNNDTVVHDRWLDALVAAMDRSDVGAVGAKLLAADGSIQEVGGVIWSDGTGHNMGRGLASDDPATDFVREVDYCSAACLLVRTDLWNQLEGFDERYAPAYYEDTDLAFSLRSMGYRVLVQPEAVVTHIEGVSHGTDPTQGVKAHQTANRAVFCEKWADALSEQPERGTSVEIASWRGGPLVLVADHRLPRPDSDSGSVRMTHLLSLLVNAGCRVTFLPNDGFRSEPYASQLLQMGIRIAYRDPDLRQFLAAAGSELALALLSRPQVAARVRPVVEGAAPEAVIAYDMVDHHGLRLERERAIEGARPAAAEETAAIELQELEASDVVIAITDLEAEHVRNEVPGAKTVTFSNVHVAPLSSPSFAHRSGLLFVGSWLHPPNRDALQFLRSEIMPLVWGRNDSITLHIAGSDIPKSAVAAHPLVHVHGWVPYLEPLFDAVRLSVAPLRYGSGQKGKVGDSLARGVPAVVSPIAAEGFGPVETALTIASGASEFADRIVALHDAEADWRDLRDRGVRLVDEHLGIAAAGRSVAQLLDVVHSRTR